MRINDDIGKMTKEDIEGGFRIRNQLNSRSAGRLVLSA